MCQIEHIYVVTQVNIFWFRRDLRLFDNHGLYQALSSKLPVIPIFIFDKNILGELPRDDARVTFIYNELLHLKKLLNAKQKDLDIHYGKPMNVWSHLVSKYDIQKVFINKDYEPYAKERDQAVENLLNEHGVEFHSFKDHVLFEKKEILTSTGSVYTVFTPYKKKWLEHFKETYLNQSKNGSFYPSEDFLDRFLTVRSASMLTLEDMGFSPSKMHIPDRSVAQKVIKNYESTRNYPGNEESTTRLGIHFRFGTISIREKAMKSYSLSQTYLSELVWRDFYAQILDNFPHVVNEAFRAKYDLVPWREDVEEFQKWCSGMTGFPLVDAGMRELNTTGYMHNRVRMITASFLTKHLLHDWRKGEAYFALKLLDFDLASNNGGWQWAAGSGTDAAPYFRIFNPTTQMEKFDKNRTYVKKWVPEYGTSDYPDPMIDHKFARERCLRVYKEALADA